MYDDDEEQEEGPKSSFTTYLAEGDVLFKQGEFKKALDSYNLVYIFGYCFVLISIVGEIRHIYYIIFFYLAYFICI